MWGAREAWKRDIKISQCGEKFWDRLPLSHTQPGRGVEVTLVENNFERWPQGKKKQRLDPEVSRVKG